MKPSSARAGIPRALPLLACLAASACGKPDDGAAAAPTAPTAAIVLARDRAAELAHPDRQQWNEARAALAPLVAREDAAAEDLLRAALVELAEGKTEPARPLVERARETAPEDPVCLWSRYRIAELEGDSQAALPVLAELRALRPDDLQVQLVQAWTLNNLGRGAEAEQEYRALLAAPAARLGAWRITVVYQLGQLLQKLARNAEAQPLFDEFNRLTNNGQDRGPGLPAHQMGTLGVVRPHTPTLFEVPRPAAPTAALDERALPVAAGTAGVGAWCLDGGRTGSDAGLAANASKEELWTWSRALALVAWGTAGLELLEKDGASWRSRALVAQPIADALPFDRMNNGAAPSDVVEKDRKKGDRDLDLLVVLAEEGQGALHLFENVAGTWSLREKTLCAHPSLLERGRITSVDLDHDGDLDLLLTLADGPRVLRNDGFDADAGGFTDATADTGLPAGDFHAIADDADGDSDVDLFLIERASGRAHLASNERGGRFSDRSATLPAGLAGAHVVAADFDGDGRVDLAAFGTELAIWRRTELAGWRPEPLAWPLAARPAGAPLALDWDLDGTTDLVWPAATGPAAGILAPGFENGGVAFELGKRFASERPGPAALVGADLDGDHDLDLVRLDASGATELVASGAGRGTLIGAVGFKDNARAVGALLELRAGLRYRRVVLRGEAELVGFGGAPLDVARVTWPNGMIQSFFDLAPGADYLFWQRRGLGGSCPFLYAWNGAEYELVSDVLGITPLGLPMAPGMLVPPDHDEYVLVRGEQLVPKEGSYELQLTEELREVTYLDRIRLDVIDHPAEVEVFPNERFTFPPFPEARVHTVRAPLAPLAALGSDGKDWKDELAENDERFAVPFEPLPDPYQGLATPHALELAFDPAAVRAAPRLRLVMNGWFFWTDASVNVAAARHPEHEFVPPLLAVPDESGENGGWRDCGPLGFPAGKLKTMVVDVTDLVNRADPRLRISSTLRLYWDSIRLAVDAGDAPFVTTAIEPGTALLWERGFSARDEQRTAHGLEWFRWDALAPPRWNQHPGLYTRFGETLPLVTAIDDRFVILGSGDCLTLRFDAAQAPPLRAGWTRDFLVFLDGWAKDRDPNTLEALFVEPLPFHGMSGYPYGPGESFPDDEEHRSWRRDWNTRPAKRWIEPLAPVRATFSPTTSQTPPKSSTEAIQAAGVGSSPSTSAAATPATSGWR